MRHFVRLILLVLCGASLANAAPTSPAYESIPALLEEVKSGDAETELNLGTAYEQGRGGPADPVAAMQWYLKAAAQGNGLAMIRMGGLYEIGKGVKKDIEEAVQWYLKAAAVEKKTGQQNYGNAKILALSRKGLTREKYVGFPGGMDAVITIPDEVTPIADQVKDLSAHPEPEQEFGSDLPYNERMLSIAAHGDAAIPYLIKLVKETSDLQARSAGLWTLNLIGIGFIPLGAKTNDFTNRPAREALWQLLKVEGLTDDVTTLLDRDPWPADVPAIMVALARVKSNYSQTISALRWYHIDKMPIDTLSIPLIGGMNVSFTTPDDCTDSNYVVLAIATIKRSSRPEWRSMARMRYSINLPPISAGMPPNGMAIWTLCLMTLNSRAIPTNPVPRPGISFTTRKGVFGIMAMKITHPNSISAPPPLPGNGCSIGGKRLVATGFAIL